MAEIINLQDDQQSDSKLPLRVINPKKLLGSKWTSVSPTNKEKHFVVTEVEFDDVGQVLSCTIQAVYTHREQQINWRDLKNSLLWLQGWK